MAPAVRMANRGADSKKPLRTAGVVMILSRQVRILAWDNAMYHKPFLGAFHLALIAALMLLPLSYAQSASIYASIVGT
jgi:hypothetical protein